MVTHKATTRWNEEPTCCHTKQLWPELNLRRSKDVIALSRHNICTVIAVLTGHWVGGQHALRLGITGRQDYCPSCHDEEEEESIEHLLCHCPAFCRTRWSTFGHPHLDNLTDLQSVRIKDLLLFLNSTKWFVRH